MINRRSIALLPAALLLARCGPETKPPAVLNLTIAGSSDQNPDINGKAQPMSVRLYQLSSTAKFQISDYFALIDHEKATLAADDLASQDYLVAPGESRTVSFTLAAGVQAVGVVASYRDIDHSQWRADAKVAASGPTNLTLSIAKLAISLK